MTNKFQKKIFLFSIFTTNVMSSELIEPDTIDKGTDSYTYSDKGEYGGGKTNEKKEEINDSLKDKDKDKDKDGGTETNTEGTDDSNKRLDTDVSTDDEKDKDKDKESRKGNKNISKELNQIREKAKGKQNEQNGIPLHKFCYGI